MENTLKTRAHAGAALYLCTVMFIILLVPSSGCQDMAERQAELPILILYAFEAEGKALSDMMTSVEIEKHLGRDVHVGQLAGHRIVLAESGVGMTNAAMTTQRMIDKFEPASVLMTGIAGGIDTGVHIGDIVVPQRWVEHDYGYEGADGFQFQGIKAYVPADDSIYRVTAFSASSELLAVAEKVDTGELGLESVGDRQPQLVVGGTAVSGNLFVDSQERREILQANFGALVTDMESAAVAQVCMINDVPVLIFRSASDLAGGSGSETAHAQMDEFFKVAADNSAKVVMAVLKRL